MLVLDLLHSWLKKKNKTSGGHPAIYLFYWMQEEQCRPIVLAFPPWTEHDWSVTAVAEPTHSFTLQCVADTLCSGTNHGHIAWAKSLLHSWLPRSGVLNSVAMLCRRTQRRTIYSSGLSARCKNTELAFSSSGCFSRHAEREKWPLPHQH